MLSPRNLCAAVVLDARRVLVIGGMSDDDTCLATTEVLGTGTMVFAPGPSMQSQRAQCAAVLLPGERRVLVVGGQDGATHHTMTEIIDIDTMTFAPEPVISLRRSSCAVVSLPGLILVVGGYDGHAGVDTTEALSLQAMTFATGPTMLTARCGCAVLALPQDQSPRRALVVGRGGGTFELLKTEMLTAAGWENIIRRTRQGHPGPPNLPDNKTFRGNAPKRDICGLGTP